MHTHAHAHAHSHTHTHKEREILERSNKKNDSAFSFAHAISPSPSFSCSLCLALSLSPPLSLSFFLSLCLTHTHTHIHTHTRTHEHMHTHPHRHRRRYPGSTENNGGKMARMWTLFCGHDLHGPQPERPWIGWLVPHQYTRAGVVWVARCRDCVMSWGRRFDSSNFESPRTDNSNLHRFELHRPSSKGTKILFHVIKAMIKAEETKTLYRCLLDINVHICDRDTLAAGCAHMCMCICICMLMHIYMDTYVRLWYCLRRWGVVAEILYLCMSVHIPAYVYVCACMRVRVHVRMYIYVNLCVCVCVRIYMYIQTRVGVHMHSCRNILFICTVQSLYYMRVYHRCLFDACMCV